MNDYFFPNVTTFTTDELLQIRHEIGKHQSLSIAGGFLHRRCVRYACFYVCNNFKSKRRVALYRDKLMYKMSIAAIDDLMLSTLSFDEFMEKLRNTGAELAH